MPTPILLRSNIEFEKRTFLDRLTTDQQRPGDPNNPDEGPGDDYVYANVGDTNNFGVGFDCSGWCGVGCALALFGPGFFANVGYYRLFSTETFAAWAEPLGFRKTTQEDCVNGSYPIKVMIMHGGGGPDSHMAMWIDGWNQESNGDFGLCTRDGEITGVGSNFWNDWWVFDGTIQEDTTYRQPMGYPRWLDYAGGHISGAALKAAGITGVCRYINDGGNGLPKKLLTGAEFIDLCRNGIQVVFNWETDSTFMLEDDGAADARAGLSYVQSLLAAAAFAGLDTGGYQPYIYFSADFDETPDQDVVIENYLNGAKSVLGVDSSGKSRAGIYGAYWILMRAHAAEAVDYLWQTEAWSGSNIDSDIALFQRNTLGYQEIEGVQCDINEAHLDFFGQFAVPITTSKGLLMALTDQEQEDLFNMVACIFQSTCGMVPNLPLLPGSPTPMPTNWPQSLSAVIESGGK